MHYRTRPAVEIPDQIDKVRPAVCGITLRAACTRLDVLQARRMRSSAAKRGGNFSTRETFCVDSFASAENCVFASFPYTRQDFLNESGFSQTKFVRREKEREDFLSPSVRCWFAELDFSVLRVVLTAVCRVFGHLFELSIFTVCLSGEGNLKTLYCFARFVLSKAIRAEWRA